MTQPAPSSAPVRQYLTFRQFAAKHPWASEGGLRWQRFHCKENGFATAFVRIGRRVLVDEVEYFRIVAEQNGHEVGQRSNADPRPGTD